MTATFTHILSPLCLAGLVLSGCAAIDDDFGTSAQEIVVFNGLNPNNLTASGLRAIDPDYAGLSDSGLAANTAWMTWMADTSTAASTFSHLVRCALGPDQTIGSIVIDGELQGPWTGQAGLATAWFENGNAVQTAEEQELVSACLLAMSNIVTENIEVSMRSVALPPPTSSLELQYELAEGHFFGNLLIASPVKQTCRPLSASNAASVEELTNALRLCALDTAECGFTYLGDCASVCSGWDSTIGTYATCNGHETVASYIHPY